MVHSLKQRNSIQAFQKKNKEFHTHNSQLFQNRPVGVLLVSMTETDQNEASSKTVSVQFRLSPFARHDMIIRKKNQMILKTA